VANSTKGFSQQSATTRATHDTIYQRDSAVFQLLKAFKLQQYAKKLIEQGFGQDIYKLALLSDDKRDDLVD